MLKKLIEDLEDVRTAIVSRDLEYANLKLQKMIIECKQSAQQSFAPDGLTPRQKEEVEQMIESAIIKASS